MSERPVAAAQRFAPTHPCPVCGGFDQAPRGQGLRCCGFLSTDGVWAHCFREEYAGALTMHPGSSTYAHRLDGPCGCGQHHRPGTPPAGNGPAHQRTIAAIYDYRDEHGDLLFQVVRYHPKSFAQRHPTYGGQGSWTWNLSGVRRVLYRLPELLAADPSLPVFITEGEKDVDRLVSLGLVATTNPGGAGKWRPGYGEVLKDRRVVILPDNDEPGRRHAQQVATSLYKVAASVKVLQLPDLPDKGDVSDWLR